jgi:hypothetical protein
MIRAWLTPALGRLFARMSRVAAQPIGTTSGARLHEVTSGP